MTPELFERARAVFDQASELPRDQREPFLDRIGAEDPEVRREVEALLAESDGAPLTGRVKEALSELTDPGIALGKHVGPYELIREIARGGMGTVYLARRADEEFRREVPVKLVG